MPYEETQMLLSCRRRGVLRLALALLPLAAAGRAVRASAAAPVAGRALVFLVTAADCPPCRLWESTFRPTFEKSPLGARLPLVLLQVPSVHDFIYANWVWPKDDRWVRDVLMAEGYPAAVPTFVLVKADSVLAVQQGIAPSLPYGWQEAFLAAAEKAVGLGG